LQLQFSKSALRCLGTALQDVRSAEATQEVRLPDGMPDIGRVLMTWGQVIVRSKEWQGSTIILTGGVTAWSLYAPEDGTEPRTIESWVPFQLKWELETRDLEGPMRMMPLLRFADSRSISSRKLMVRVGVSALVQAMYPMEAEYYTAGELPEDVQILKRSYLARVPVESGERTFLMDEELRIPDSSAAAEKILAVTVSPEVSEKKVLTDKVLFKGMLNLHLVYRDGEGRIHRWNQAVPFSQLAELDRSHGLEAQADVRMAVTSLEADLEDPGKLRLKCGLVGQYLIEDQYLLDLVQDAYSPFREVKPECMVLELPVILEDRTEIVTAEQTLPGQVGQIADGIFLPDFPRSRRMADSLEMELPGMFQTLIYDENDSLQGLSSRWENKIKLPADESCRIMTLPYSSGEVQGMTSGDGMILSASMMLQLQGATGEGIPMVTGLEMGEVYEPDPARPSVILRNSGKKTLWELAKESGSTVPAIAAANGLTGDCAENQMLLIPIL